MVPKFVSFRIIFSAMLSKTEFENLSPKHRGYAVYMAGSRDDQPNIPDEDNPYPINTWEHEQWNIGQNMAILEAQDSEE